MSLCHCFIYSRLSIVVDVIYFYCFKMIIHFPASIRFDFAPPNKKRFVYLPHQKSKANKWRKKNSPKKIQPTNRKATKKHKKSLINVTPTNQIGDLLKTICLISFCSLFRCFVCLILARSNRIDEKRWKYIGRYIYIIIYTYIYETVCFAIELF